MSDFLLVGRRAEQGERGAEYRYTWSWAGDNGSRCRREFEDKSSGCHGTRGRRGERQFVGAVCLESLGRPDDLIHFFVGKRRRTRQSDEPGLAAERREFAPQFLFF
jgi:hypothetical protein